MENKNTKEEKKKKAKKRFLTFLIILLVISIVGVIFLYFMLSDDGRSNYKVRNADTSEIIKKNYIDAFKDISSTGKFDFKLPEEDINEFLSLGVKELNNSYVESIYYKSGEENHHFFYVDLNVPIIKTRVVFDTVAVGDSLNNKLLLGLQSCSIGKISALPILKELNLFNAQTISEIGECCNLPISFDETTNYFTIDFNSYISSFPTNDIMGMMIDVIKQDPQSITVDPSVIGFSVDFSRYKNPTYNSAAQTDVIPNLMERVSTAFNALDYDALPTGESQFVSSLSDVEFSNILNDSFEKKNDTVVTSTLTTNQLKVSIEKVNFEIIDPITTRLCYDVSINDYIININQGLSLDQSEGGYYLAMQLDSKIKIGSIEFSEFTNPYVSLVSNLFKPVLNGVNAKHSSSFFTNEQTLTIAIDLSEIVVSSLKLKSLEKSIAIDSVNHCFSFLATKN